MLLLIPISLLLVALAIAAFFWAVDHAQFEALDRAAREPLDSAELDPLERYSLSKHND
jgi:cbb3-type cytochrome oxidase maturation protein